MKLIVNPFPKTANCPSVLVTVIFVVPSAAFAAIEMLAVSFVAEL